MKKQNLVPTLSNNMSQQEKNVLKEIDRVNQKECDPIEKKPLLCNDAILHRLVLFLFMKARCLFY